MSDLSPRREPALNLPGVVVALLAAMAAIHLVRTQLLTEAQDLDLLVRFAFVPGRYDGSAEAASLPGGALAGLWTPVTYALLHGDWGHFLMNGIWLAAFGSALARRFGTVRFLVFSALAAAAGAGVFYLAHPGAWMPVIGASGAISGQMAAAARFVFQVGGPLAARRGDRRVFETPALPLGRLFADRQVVVFLGLWIVSNLLFGLGVVTLAGEDSPIAWEAHLGGFAFGLVAFSLFDPVRPPAAAVPAADRD